MAKPSSRPIQELPDGRKVFNGKCKKCGKTFYWAKKDGYFQPPWQDIACTIPHNSYCHTGTIAVHANGTMEVIHDEINDDMPTPAPVPVTPSSPPATGYKSTFKGILDDIVKAREHLLILRTTIECMTHPRSST